MTEEIDIAFCANAAHSAHIAAVIASIVERATGARLRFIILHDGIPSERQALMEAVAPSARFFWAEVGDNDVPSYTAINSHFSRAILFRLALEKLAPADCRRLLYLDTDVIVLGDVRDICRTDLKGAPLGAVVDGYYLDGADFARRWGLAPAAIGYFNSGVMLIDLERVRAERLFAAAIDLVARHGAEFRFADQDALNIVTWNRWRPLPPTWNAQRDMVIPALAERLPAQMRFHDRLPELVQYTGPEKPWQLKGYHPWAWLYWHALARTAFFDETATTSGIGRLHRLRLWLRWLRRQPSRRSRAAARYGDRWLRRGPQASLSPGDHACDRRLQWEDQQELPSTPRGPRT